MARKNGDEGLMGGMAAGRPSLPRSHLPQSFNRPSSYYLDDGPSIVFAFDDLAYFPSSSHSLLESIPKRGTVEQEFGAYIALEHALQATLVRQRAAAELRAASANLPSKPRSSAFSSTSSRRTQVEDRTAQRRRGLLRVS
ncbi:hypothetical protein BC826DRAFT_1109432 [Russula brevipes]|nr:hypothetical protein BC826DRAFT_1109432 [Russula brevipes]